MRCLNILDYGAKNNCLCTTAIQNTINAAALIDAVVVVPEGIYITGSLDLKSITLVLEKGSILKGSSNIKDYKVLPIIHNEMEMINPLLYSVESDGVCIEGSGTIDLNAKAFFTDERIIPDYGVNFSEIQIKECTRKYKTRSFQPIFFWKCKNISLANFTVIDAPCWTFSFSQCENIRVNNLTIDNCLTVPNNDGMHFCGCKNVLISGCIISAGDDCIALTSITDWNIPTENVVISDCVLRSCSKAISIGYMHSIVRDVTIKNCIIRESQRGIAIMSSTGTGLVENIIISGIVIETKVHAGNWWGNGEPICIMAVNHNYDNYKFAVPKRNWKINITNIIIRDIICEAENTIAIIGEHKNIQKIIIDGVLYQQKESDNRYLKGEKCIDLAPSEKKVNANIREDAVYCEEVSMIYINNVYSSSTSGAPLKTEIK